MEKNRFAELRASKGLTQREVAEAVGVTVTTVSNWERKEREHRISVSQVARLCAVLGEDVETLAKLWEE